jgi:hypothetical protein
MSKFALIKNNDFPKPKAGCGVCRHSIHFGKCRKPVNRGGKLEICGCVNPGVRLKEDLKKAA